MVNFSESSWTELQAVKPCGGILFYVGEHPGIVAGFVVKSNCQFKRLVAVNNASFEPHIRVVGNPFRRSYDKRRIASRPD